jgi:hypothetical protein
MNDQVTWDQVPQSEIDSELAYWRKRRASVVWLVPCRYSDGKPTCSGSDTLPYSNALRRQYVLTAHWEQQF